MAFSKHLNNRGSASSSTSPSTSPGLKGEEVPLVVAADRLVDLSLKINETHFSVVKEPLLSRKGTALWL